jgi:3-hydroxyisobutyrate dehydrogenase-like beta-hydroxyacid dehydrogenase
MSVTIGFIGAGQLGEPMVRRLLDAGNQVLVYARRAEVRERLANHGAALADSVSELSGRSDILISCLFSDAQLRDVGWGPDGLAAAAKPGTVFVSHTTGEVAMLAELAALAPNLAVVDAPVSGTAEDIAAGTLTVLIGGPDDAVQRAQAVLTAYASPIIATGELGTALHLKLVNNLLFAANAQLVVSAAHLGQQLGIDPQRLLDVIGLCSAASTASAHIQRIGGLQAFEAGAAPFLRKDVAACLVAAEAVGADLGFLGLVVEGGPLSLTSLRHEGPTQSRRTAAQNGR